MDQLDKIRVLGVGTFGTTYLVQHVVTDKSYAIKVVHKQTISLLKLEENLFHERDIMLLLTDCQYVAALYATLQDNHSLYMIQQYVHGGDLFNLLYSKKFPATKLGGLPIPQVAFYASNLFAAVSQIHQQEIVHRDLRLENLVRVVLSTSYYC